MMRVAAPPASYLILLLLAGTLGQKLMPELALSRHSSSLGSSCWLMALRSPEINKEKLDVLDQERADLEKAWVQRRMMLDQCLELQVPVLEG